MTTDTAVRPQAPAREASSAAQDTAARGRPASEISADTWKPYPVSAIIGGPQQAAQERRAPGKVRQVVRGIRHMSLLGSAKSKFGADVFPGGRIIVLLGGGELDLSQAKLPAEGATLTVLSAFGAYQIIVPADWNVTMRAATVVASVDDKRKAAPATRGGTLTLTGLVFFGGASVK